MKDIIADLRMRVVELEKTPIAPLKRTSEEAPLETVEEALATPEPAQRSKPIVIPIVKPAEEVKSLRQFKPLKEVKPAKEVKHLEEIKPPPNDRQAVKFATVSRPEQAPPA
jgi:hypothetical protein